MGYIYPFRVQTDLLDIKGMEVGMTTPMNGSMLMYCTCCGLDEQTFLVISRQWVSCLLPLMSPSGRACIIVQILIAAKGWWGSSDLIADKK